MNGGPSAPTSADYANSAAQDAKIEIKKLEKRVSDLERQVVYLMGQIRRLR